MQMSVRMARMGLVRCVKRLVIEKSQSKGGRERQKNEMREFPPLFSKKIWVSPFLYGWIGREKTAQEHVAGVGDLELGVALFLLPTGSLSGIFTLGIRRLSH